MNAKKDSAVKRVEPGSYHPNDALAQAIVNAWSEHSFREALLTFPENAKPIWDKKSSADYPKKIASTREALEKVGVYLENPIVLTEEQYRKYAKKSDDEVVFVLPDEPSKAEGKKSLDTARVKMGVTVKGM
jgi:hypothetical protein